jgi:DNA-binding CsgD family transcriptional regulator
LSYEERSTPAFDRGIRLIPFHRLGWGFLLAWVFCTFYTDIASHSIGSTRIASQVSFSPQILIVIMPVAMAVLMLVLLVLGEHRWGPAVRRRSLLIAAPVAASISTPLLFASTGDPFLTMMLFVLGAVLTGFGSGLMWVFWGEFYTRSTQEDVESLAPISAGVAALLALAASAMSGWVALALVASLPIVSGVCFIVAWGEVEGGKAVPDWLPLAEHGPDAVICERRRIVPLEALRAMGRSGWGILIACLFVCIEGSFWQGDESASIAFQIVIVLSALFMLFIGSWSTLGPRRISIAFLYRWMCPILVAGFAALTIFDAGMGPFIAFGVSVAARFAFCLITQMYFARFSAYGRATPTQSYGFGWIFVHVGDMLGVLVFSAINAALGSGLCSQSQVAAFCMAVLVAVTMLVLNDDDSFAGLSGVGYASASRPAGAVPAFEAPVSDGDGLQTRIDALAREYDLTPREGEVFSLLMRGRSIPYIRDELVISRETVATHVKHIYAKADVHTRQELLDLAL